MKFIIVLAIAFGLVAAAPQQRKLRFRNLFVEPIYDADRPKVNPRIIGGQEAEPHSIPHQAFMEVYTLEGSGWYCGGTLISDNYVLTAGHCGVDGAKAEIILGAHDIMDDEDTQILVTSLELKVHEEFNAERFENDIAILKLTEPIQQDDNVKAVTLPSKADASNDNSGNIGTVSGWGFTDDPDGGLSDVLMVANATIITNEECNKTFGVILPQHVCISGGDQTGTCNGDSGGPLSANGKQVGIVSFAAVGCPTGYPSVFTRVTQHLDWIEKNSDVKIGN